MLFDINLDDYNGEENIKILNMMKLMNQQKIILTMIYVKIILQIMRLKKMKNLIILTIRY